MNFSPAGLRATGIPQTLRINVRVCAIKRPLVGCFSQIHKLVCPIRDSSPESCFVCGAPNRSASQHE